MYACDVPSYALVYGKPSKSTLMRLVFLFFPETGSTVYWLRSQTLSLQCQLPNLLAVDA